MRTYSHDFTRPDGSTVTVEYTFREGSPTTYSPYSGADGGDPAECEIEKAYVNDTEIQLPDEDRERYEEWIIGNVVHDWDCDYD